jgi:peptidyl-prolyl cis-trans isomerase SurA
MINLLRVTFLLAISLSSLSQLFAQNTQVTDKIVAVVNERIILKSDVDDEVRNYINQMQMNNQNIQFSEDLWYDALQSMVDNYVMLEKAELDSVVVSDEMVDRQMDQRLNQMIRQAGGESQLEQVFGQSIIQIRADFREQFREQMIVQQLRQSKYTSIDITRPEVEAFFNSIPQDSIPLIPEQVGVSQIVEIPEPLEDAKDQAFQRALAIRDSIVNQGMEFEEMARKYSEDGSSSRGGLLPMMSINDLVANYSAAATALEPGQISEVVETEFGYHIIRLNRRMGDNIETNHILIRIDDSLVDEEAAIEKLNALRDSVLNHGADFNELARRHSDDEETKAFGGRIINPQTGERLLPISQLEPSIYRIALLLDEEGQISEPRSFTPRSNSSSVAYRIVRLDRLIPEHRANLNQDYERIRDIALSRKQSSELRQWLSDLRDEVYIEFKIPVPDNNELSESQDPAMPGTQTEPQ